ncbi:MAG: response regulator [Candidatus Omnitrophota bacterium]
MPGKILIVDDDPDFREAMATLLEAKGYDVGTASDGEAGLAKAREILPDIILLDVMMSGTTEGFDVARKLHAEDKLKDIPVVMTTGIRKDMNLPFGFEPDNDTLPVKEVLEKPVKPETLLSAVAKHIRTG